MVVHFPIALLTIYALFEILRLRQLMEKAYWFYLKGVFVILGEVGAIAAFLTGERGIHYGEGIRLIEMHQKFGTFTAIVFGIIALAYAMEWRKPNTISLSIMRPWIIIPLAVIGLISITITGGLGGAIVYGTGFDPLMAPVFKLLGV